MQTEAIDPKIVDKYQKVARLEAQAATDGERNAASKMRAKFEAKYPGIAEAARVNEAREETKKKMRDSGFPMPEEGAGFDDTEFFQAYDDLFTGIHKDQSDKGMAERLFWKAMGWAVDKVSEADFRPPPPPPREPPPPPKSAKANSHDTRLREEVEVYDAFVGEHPEHDEIIEIHFAISGALWDDLARSKQGSLKLLKYLDKQVEDGDSDDSDDEDET
jgi:hypothetical protein